MKKIIALALALIMALSMASVAFAAEFAGDSASGIAVTGKYAPGSKITVSEWAVGALKGYKLADDFTTGSKGYKGASLIEDIAIDKDKDSVVITLKESEKLLEDAREVNGEIVITNKAGATVATITVDIDVNNNYVEVSGDKKAAKAIDISEELWYAAEDGNTVVIMDEDGGYVSFTDTILKGVVKMEKDEKTMTGIAIGVADEDTRDAIDACLPEDFDAIVEEYVITGKGFKNEVAYTYKAYEDDPHFFYVFNGEELVALDAKYDADEDVDAYVFNYTGAGVLVITDEEIVLAAEETKNPDTGANDIVGVAAALAVVSLVAAGAVSLKK